MDSSSLRYSDLWAVEAQFPLCPNNPTMPQGLKTAGRARCCWWSPSAALHKAKWWISCRIHLRGTVRSKMETGLETSSNMNPKSIQDIRSKVCQGGRGRHRPVVHDTNLNEFPRAMSRECGWKWRWSGLWMFLSALRHWQWQNWECHVISSILCAKRAGKKDSSGYTVWRWLERQEGLSVLPCCSSILP